jgi:predicted nucleotide-binding protein
MRSEERPFLRTRFSVEVIKEAVKVFDRQVNPTGKLKPVLEMTVIVEGPSIDYPTQRMDVQRGHDDEEEFFADYRKFPDGARYVRTYRERNRTIALMRIGSSAGISESDLRVAVKIEAERMSQIMAVFNVFDAYRKESALTVDTTPKKEGQPVVFIGHGHSGAWKELRDHLQDKQGFKIEAYEIGARAGHTVRDILQSMLEKASIAFLVMTGEDETAGGALNPRLNVVHEAGLFQGKLGFNRAIILLETGVPEFSNIHGIEEIRFTNIKEVFGDVVATIRREFPNA